MNTYIITQADGSVSEHQASDMRALLTIIDFVWQADEPIKVELAND